MSGNWKKTLLFIGLTFSVSYRVAISFHLLGGKWNTTEAIVVAVIYMFIPMVMAIFVQKVIYGQAVKGPLGISWKLNRWFLVAWLLPPAIAFGTLGVSLLLPGIKYSPDLAGLFERFERVVSPEKLQEMKEQVAAFPLHPIWLGLLQGLVAGVSINAVAGFGEELGWRGFLQRELGFLGFWKSAALIGLIWGVWHAPLILQGHNYPQHPAAGVLMMGAFCLLLSPLFSYIRLKAGSVLAAAILHGTLNATGGLALMVVKGGDDLTIGITGVAGLIVLAILDVGIFLLVKAGTLREELRSSAA